MFEGSLDTSDIFLTNFIEGGMECIDMLTNNDSMLKKKPHLH